MVAAMIRRLISSAVSLRHCRRTDQKQRAVLGVMELESRETPALLTETTTLTEALWGNTATLNLTVTEVGNRYQWDYELVNNSIDYAYDNPEYDLGIGLFELYTASGVLFTDTVTSSAGWYAYIGDLDGEPGLIRWMVPGGNGLLPGGSVTFSFQTQKVDIINGGVGISDPGYAVGGGGPAKVPGKQPTADLQVSGLDDATEANAPGRKIHINDNFDEGQQTATALVSDYLSDPVTGRHQIKVGDADLVTATLKLKSAAVNWSLDWTIDPKVKVWYKEWNGANAGKWFEAEDKDFVNVAVPAQIDLLLEGVNIGAGSVKVELVVNNSNLKVSDEFAFTVYTGLKLTGTKADDAKGQLATATGWTLTRNADGFTWRTGGTKNPEQWREDARAAIGTVLESDNVTAVAAENKKEVIVGSWALQTIDPSDIAVFAAADERFAAAAIVHEIYEQYNGQVLGKNYDDSHAAAIVVEARIVAGGGTRTETIEPIPGEPNKKKNIYEYQGGITIIWYVDFDNPTNIYSIAVARP